MSAMLFEPVIAQVLGYALGIDVQIGWLTIIAIPVVLIGTFYVNRGTYVMVQKNMRHISGTSIPGSQVQSL